MSVSGVTRAGETAALLRLAGVLAAFVAGTAVQRSVAVWLPRVEMGPSAVALVVPLVVAAVCAAAVYTVVVDGWRALAGLLVPARWLQHTRR